MQKLPRHLGRSVAAVEEPKPDHIRLDIRKWTNIVSIIEKFQHDTTASRDSGPLGNGRGPAHIAAPRPYHWSGGESCLHPVRQ